MKKKIEYIIPIIIILVLIVKSTSDLYGIKNVFSSIKNSTYTNNEKINKDDKLSIVDGKKETYEEALKKEPYTFSIVNNNNYKVRYNIYLKEYEELINLDNCNDKKIKLDNISYLLNDKKEILKNNENNNYIIYSGILNSNEKKNFDLRIWINNNTKFKVENKHLHLKIYYDITKINTSLKELLKIKSNKNKKYYIDTDNNKEIYKVDNEYLYIGLNPNNYIYFNCTNNNLKSCELWRILGIKKVLLSNLKTKYRVKIVKDNFYNENVKYEEINLKSNNKKIEKVVIKDNNKYKETYFTILSEDDFKESFYNGFDDSCFADLKNCNKRSYLYKDDDEWITMNNDYYRYISKEGSLMETENNSYNYYRPVVFLKDDIKVLGGDGSKTMPYFFEYQID